MSRPARSLAAQLVVALFVVQSACIVAAMMVFPIIAPFTTYRSISDRSARRLIVESVKAYPNGRLRLVPSVELQAYARIRPHLNFAAKLAGGPIVSGSSKALAKVLLQTGSFLPLREDAIKISLFGQRDEAVFVSTQKFQGGYLILAVAGDEFHPDDIPTFVHTFLPAILPAYGPIFLGMLIGIPLVLKRMLGPVRLAARAAALIDIRSLDQRLPIKRVPSEFLPLVRAINDALDRLSEGWERQRLFTANAAHELRTPVTVLQARVATLPADAHLRTALIHDVRRLALLIDQLLAIARLERREVPLRPLELVALTRGVVADWAPVAISAGLSLSFASARAAVWIQGDARALEGAIAALIDNALKVEPPGEGVEVVVSSGASVTVLDHGPGIDPADRETVFEPFWRKDERPAGSGLGLATVRETAKLHQGNVFVETTAGAGAVFTIRLPENPSTDPSAIVMDSGQTSVPR